ncbi:MAG: hypothetical protein COV99_00080 [Bacteroidetes bacterium CG12_big_fil_rev_8_21_14_0_65_60_17]|nr:MAG: hypothetical protein COV99_00080 [Bacteroidetes bacterium CG12_big_fil_rev_8_21_14_0_65_60_17]
MSEIHDLIAEAQRMETERAELQRQLDSVKKKAQKELKKEIDRMCSVAGTSVEELYGVKLPSAPKKGRKSKAASGKKKTTRRRRALPDKYLVGGKGVDGRKARKMPEFDSVRVDGKIDDEKALAAKMINPVWLSTDSPVVKRFIKDYGVDPAKYSV